MEIVLVFLVSWENIFRLVYSFRGWTAGGPAFSFCFVEKADFQEPFHGFTGGCPGFGDGSFSDCRGYSFTYFLGLSTIPMQLVGWVAGMAISRYFVLAAILLVYLFLGCFIDAVSMMVLTLPVVFPLILQLGFDPIAFGVVCVLMMDAGLITPPMGLNLFTIAGTAKDVSMEEIYLGALPFVIPILIVVVIVAAFPETALFLPRMMLGR